VLALSAPAATGREHAERYPGHWKPLAILLLLMSLDEAASLHEGTIEPLRSALGTGGPFYYAWVIPGMVFVLAFALAYRGFLLGLPPKTRGMFAVAGTLYVCGALVTEMVGGVYADSYGEVGIAYLTITSVEEYLEMLGVATLLYALMLRTGEPLALAGTAAESSGFRAEVSHYRHAWGYCHAWGYFVGPPQGAPSALPASRRAANRAIVPTPSTSANPNTVHLTGGPSGLAMKAKAHPAALADREGARLLLERKGAAFLLQLRPRGQTPATGERICVSGSPSSLAFRWRSCNAGVGGYGSRKASSRSSCLRAPR
jgi:hypothetical protein